MFIAEACRVASFERLLTLSAAPVQTRFFTNIMRFSAPRSESPSPVRRYVHELQLYVSMPHLETGKQDLQFGRGRLLVYHQTRTRIMTMTTLIQNLHLRLHPRRQIRSAMNLNQKFHHLNRKVIPQLHVVGCLPYLTYCRCDLSCIENPNNHA